MAQPTIMTEKVLLFDEGLCHCYLRLALGSLIHQTKNPPRLFPELDIGKKPKTLVVLPFVPFRPPSYNDGWRFFEKMRST